MPKYDGTAKYDGGAKYDQQATGAEGALNAARTRVESGGRRLRVVFDPPEGGWDTPAEDDPLKRPTLAVTSGIGGSRALIVGAPALTVDGAGRLIADCLIGDFVWALELIAITITEGWIVDTLGNHNAGGTDASSVSALLPGHRAAVGAR